MKTKKKRLDELFIKKYGEEANEEAQKEAIQELKRVIGKWRFEKSTTGSVLASSPDFTIIAPSGCIEQFEVKFRSDGELSEEEKGKYLKRNAMPNIFIIMTKEPYIKILKPWLEEIPIDYSKDFKDVIKQMESWEKRIYAKEKWYYNELEREEDDSLIFRSTALKSEVIVYPKSLLEKYERIIQKWFQEKDL